MTAGKMIFHAFDRASGTCKSKLVPWTPRVTDRSQYLEVSLGTNDRLGKYSLHTFYGVILAKVVDHLLRCSCSSSPATAASEMYFVRLRRTNLIYKLYKPEGQRNSFADSVWGDSAKQYFESNREQVL